MRNHKNKLIAAAIMLGVIGWGFGLYKLNHPAPDPVAMSDSTSTISTAISEVAAGKATLIDVRTPAEYAAGHAKGAINFDSVNVQAGQLPNMSKSTKVYVYCHSGSRAAIVQPIMQQAGFTDVTSLGALQSWYDAGGPKA
ncbi:rhodanese-like domain-containing protein [Candidatus Saccharibacteria bacterium]|nr:rhodanese-like domain-containing protein [Candidatus Saccharibacteria bacterium]